jgi:hypothetical protein
MAGNSCSDAIAVYHRVYGFDRRDDWEAMIPPGMKDLYIYFG